jgi:hypothetical protein
MSIEVETLVETYNILREFIPSKERQDAADSLMSYLVDQLNDLDLTELSGADSYMKRSYVEYAEQFEEDDDYEDYEE